MRYDLALSLGHNSSAVLIEKGNILIGYENERLSGIKSDSQFPKESIEEIGKYYDLNLINRVYVSHWATFGKVDGMREKYWQRNTLKELCPNAEVMSSVDHHDCHVHALRVFAGPFEWEIVADGFGNFNETVSIYNKGVLVHRAFGFEKSIGLLYQYATAYLDLKMNQDEFKLLGYESHIDEIENLDREVLAKAIYKYAKTYANNILEAQLKPEYDLVAGLEALPNIRENIRHKLDYLLTTKLGFKKDIDINIKRVVVAYFIQGTVEQILLRIINHFGMTEVALTGGVFMNVKVNNIIAKKVNRISILPICGDQGAALGAYQYYNKDLKWPGHLFWGRRNLKDIEALQPNLFVINKWVDFEEKVVKSILEDKIINIVFKHMEFGARALGSTTTLAKPTAENVRYINHVNERSTIMPMAGMISSDMLSAYKEPMKVHKSLDYMITTLDSNMEINEYNIGCHHLNPDSGIYTNRVQLVDAGHFLYKIIKRFGLLINTSFNKHGVPIVFNRDQIIDTHSFQQERDKENRVITIVFNA